MASGIIARSSKSHTSLVDFKFSNYNCQTFDIGNLSAKAMDSCGTDFVRPYQTPLLDCNRRFSSLQFTSMPRHTPVADAVADPTDSAEQIELFNHF